MVTTILFVVRGDRTGAANAIFARLPASATRM